MRHNENLECDPHGGHALLGDVRAEIGGPTPPQRATMAVVLPWSAIGGLASTIALVPDGTRKLVVQCGKRYPSTWREWRCGKGALTREHYSRWFMKASWAPFHSHGWLVEVVLGPRMGWLRHGCFFSHRSRTRVEEKSTTIGIPTHAVMLFPFLSRIFFSASFLPGSTILPLFPLPLRFVRPRRLPFAPARARRRRSSCVIPTASRHERSRFVAHHPLCLQKDLRGVHVSRDPTRIPQRSAHASTARPGGRFPACRRGRGEVRTDRPRRARADACTWPPPRLRDRFEPEDPSVSNRDA